MTTRHILARQLRRLLAGRRGVATVEFAIALPLLLTMYMGGYIVTDMVTCNRKVTVATRELTDIATRYPELPASQVATIIGASQQVLNPYNFTNAMVRLSEVQVVDATHVQVVWSKAYVGGSESSTDEYNSGTSITVDQGLIPAQDVPSATTSGTYCTVGGANGGYSPTGVTNVPAGCLMLGEVRYAYKPPIAYGFTNINLTDTIYMVPRVSSGIPLLNS